jgi:hypothetical protein
VTEATPDISSATGAATTLVIEAIRVIEIIPEREAILATATTGMKRKRKNHSQNPKQIG